MKKLKKTKISNFLKILFCIIILYSTTTFSQDAATIFKNASKSTGIITDGRNMGSGFFINNKIFITNYHVVDHLNENNAEIRTQTKSYSIDKIIEKNKEVDLVLIQVSDSSDSYLNIGNSFDIIVGMNVYAIGNPSTFDEKVFKNTFTNGIVNNIVSDKVKNRNFYIDSKVILHSADLNPGNSGGPLLNDNGEVVGINAYIRNNIEKMKFAIHVDELVILLERNGINYTKGKDITNASGKELPNINETKETDLSDLFKNTTGIKSNDTSILKLNNTGSGSNPLLFIIIVTGFTGLALFFVIYKSKKPKHYYKPVKSDSLPDTLIRNKNISDNINDLNKESRENSDAFLLYDNNKIDLKKKEIIVGRDSGCDLCISDKFSSRYQFRINYNNRNYILTDLNSKNGTLVNDLKIFSKILADGDIISVGNNKILFKSNFMQ